MSRRGRWPALLVAMSGVVQRYLCACVRAAGGRRLLFAHRGSRRLLEISRACGMALTLNANTSAEEADAKEMSDSLIAPTEPDKTFIFTNELPIFSNAAFIASKDPCTSVFIMTGSSEDSPA